MNSRPARTRMMCSPTGSAGANQKLTQERIGPGFGGVRRPAPSAAAGDPGRALSAPDLSFRARSAESGNPRRTGDVVTFSGTTDTALEDRVFFTAITPHNWQ